VIFRPANIEELAAAQVFTARVGQLFSGFLLNLSTPRIALGGSSVRDLHHWWHSLSRQSPT